MSANEKVLSSSSSSEPRREAGTDLDGIEVECTCEVTGLENVA